MKRREEIVKATKECREDYVGLGRHLTTDDIADAFEEGAEWADKTMIEKAVEWLEDIDYVMQYQYSEDGCTFFNKDKFIKDFRKAMEE